MIFKTIIRRNRRSVRHNASRIVLITTNVRRTGDMVSSLSRNYSNVINIDDNMDLRFSPLSLDDTVQSEHACCRCQLKVQTGTYKLARTNWHDQLVCQFGLCTVCCLNDDDYDEDNDGDDDNNNLRESNNY